MSFIVFLLLYSTETLSNLVVGNFYYMNKKLVLSNLEPHNDSQIGDDDQSLIVVCVLSANKKKTKFIVQPYLRVSDADDIVWGKTLIEANLKKVKKFFDRECLKSDLYALITLTQKSEFKPCFVMSAKDYLTHKVNISNPKNVEVSLLNDLYMCESMYSTCHKYFRKLNYKKWQPLKFLGEELVDETTDELKLELAKRIEPVEPGLLLARKFLDESVVQALIHKVDLKLGEFTGLPTFFKAFYCDTVAYDSPPARFKEEKEPDEVILQSNIMLSILLTFKCII